VPGELDRQRVDRWLWHARVVRTRGAAAALAGSGYVRVNGARIDAASRVVRTGDVITVALDRSVRVLKVLGFVERRGPAGTGETLYEDLAEAVDRGTAVRALRADHPCDRSKAPKKPV
jgi:ribosome-associated heat shock protein Hsp15